MKMIYKTAETTAQPSASEQLLAEHKEAIHKEVDRFVTLYVLHGRERDAATARSFINNYRSHYQEAVSKITDAALEKLMTQDIPDKAEFLKRIIVQDRQAMADLIEKIAL